MEKTEGKKQMEKCSQSLDAFQKRLKVRIGQGHLRPAFEKFPKETIIPYNLACYAAQMGRLDEAWEWLHKAMAAAESVNRIKQMALADPDLQPLLERIKDL